MARPLRIEYPGALYHAISRGNEKKDIFKDNRDRVKFLDLLEECCERFGIIIYCYVLMGNHYHLLLETPQGNLHRVMHWLNATYVSYFNYRHKRSGSLLQGRYKAILVDKDHYLLELTRYIHLNPYRAGMVTDPSFYRWSSYRAYLGIAKRMEWVDYSAILSIFSSTESTAREKYMDYVNKGLDEPTENLMERLYGQVILGDKSFISKIKAKYNRDTVSTEITDHKKFGQKLEAEEIFSAVEQTLSVRREHLLKKSCKNNLARKIALFMMKKYTYLNNQEIAALFCGIHYTTVSKQCSRFKEELTQNSDIKAIYEKVDHIIKNKL